MIAIRDRRQRMDRAKNYMPKKATTSVDIVVSPTVIEIHAQRVALRTSHFRAINMLTLSRDVSPIMTIVHQTVFPMLTELFYY